MSVIAARISLILSTNLSLGTTKHVSSICAQAIIVICLLLHFVRSTLRHPSRLMGMIISDLCSQVNSSPGKEELRQIQSVFDFTLKCNLFVLEIIKIIQ
jgi:hypothetical protein